MRNFCIVCGTKLGFNDFPVEEAAVCDLKCLAKYKERPGFYAKAEESETFSNEQAILGTSSYIASVLIFLGWLGLFAAIFLMMYLGDSLSGQGMMSILAVGIVGWAQMVGFGTVINVLYEIKNKL